MSTRTDDLLTQTVLQMHGSIVTLSSEIGRLNGQVSTFITQMATQDDRTTKLEVRTTKVEHRQHWYAGAGTVIGALAARWLPGVNGLLGHP